MLQLCWLLDHEEADLLNSPKNFNGFPGRTLHPYGFWDRSTYVHTKILRLIKSSKSEIRSYSKEASLWHLAG